jgi:probable F420-dependent oxidoreductase
MTARAFRFGVVAGQPTSGKAWIEQAQRIEDLGFSTIVVPDGMQRVLSPFPALAAIAAATSTIRIGTYVAANDYRNPVMLAKEAASLDVLSDGRFELGIGAGRPDAGRDLAMMGLPFDRGGVRLNRLAESIGIIKSLFEGKKTTAPGPYYAVADAEIGPKPVQQPHPPILIAAAGDKMLELAGREADIVAFGIQPTATEAELASRIDLLKTAAGDRFDQIELNLNLMGIGDRTHPWLEHRLGLTAAKLRELGAVSCLFGTIDEMCNQHESRRDRLGISYLLVGDAFIDDFAPVVERLSGR